MNKTPAPPDHLWQHQKEAFEKIVPLDCGLLAMDMGTGKSATAIAILEAWECKRVIILCPKSVIPVWKKQFIQFAQTGPWTVELLASGKIKDREKTMLQALKDADRYKDSLAVVVNYDVMPYSFGDLLKKVADKFDCIIFDESHKLKSASGATSRKCSQVSDRIPHRLALTGTPMPHSPLDVYAQYRAINKRVFGTSNTVFKAQYAVVGGFKNHTVVAYKNLDDLHRRMYTCAFRCKTSEVLDLPPFIDVQRYCTLSPAEEKIYTAMQEEFVAEIAEGLVTAENALSKLIRLAQITGGFVKTEEGEIVDIGTSKSDALLEVLEELAPDYGETQKPVVVFARFHNDIDRIKGVFDKLEITHGELSGRRNELAGWQRGETDGLVVQLQSGGVGIDLTRACTCIYYSNEFSLGNYEQSRARVHRPGQTMPVTYIHILAEKTVDIVIQRALSNKAEIVNHVIDTMRNLQGEVPE